LAALIFPSQTLPPLTLEARLTEKDPKPATELS
jgi:hypothetical protein